MQHKRREEGANWNTKWRKFLALFGRADILEQFFSTRTPRVLVITMDKEYVFYHKQCAEEVLPEAADRGRAYSNRFLLGAYDTGISDMTLPPEQFFCTPRFYTPYRDVAHPSCGS